MPSWKVQRERRELRQRIAEHASRTNYPRRYQLIADESARNLMACIRPAALPWNSPWLEKLTRAQRELVDLDNVLAQAAAERDAAHRGRRH